VKRRSLLGGSGGPGSLRPIRVLYLEDGAAFGGAILSLSDLLKGFEELAGDQRPVESIVVTYLPETITDGLFPFSEVVHQWRPLDYRTRALFNRGIPKVPILNRFRRVFLTGYNLADLLQEWVLSLRLLFLLRGRSVDFIHLNNGFQRTGIRAARWAGLPAIIHLRGFKKKNPKKISEVFGGKVEKTVKKYIGVSDAVCDGLREMDIPESRIRPIHDPISFREFRVDDSVGREVREEFGVPQDSTVVSVFGRVTGWKGQLEFLEALAPIMGDHPELMIMIVGDESDSAGKDYFSRVMAKAETEPLNGRVVFTGYQKNMPRFFNAADIIVHCSVDPEPFGRVIPEGMAAGRAVIAMNEGGPPEMVEDGVDGLLVRPRDPEALRKAVARLVEDAELRARLAAEGKRTVERKFSPAGHAAQVLACYRDE